MPRGKKRKSIKKPDEQNEEFQEFQKIEQGEKQQSLKKTKEVFKSLKEEILKRASWKNGVTVTGLTMFLSEHPEKNNLTKVIHELAKENKITITPIQIKKEAALFGASYQTLIKTIE
ncbi:MAG: hypothetical protein WC917_04595 [Bacilli bacterium]|jgi:hypothetical protein